MRVKRNTDNKRLFPDEDGSSEEDEQEEYYDDSPEEFDDEEERGRKKVIPQNSGLKPVKEKKIEFVDDSPGKEKENEENSVKRKSKLDEKRRRRRSSARFLCLSGRQEDDDDSSKPAKEQDQEKLSQMYKKALRMNAENRINAGNTWSLSLIDHLDKFLEADDEIDNDDNNMAAHIKSRPKKKQITPESETQPRKEKRINFTKASITLDASVKIYSYRVDDTHLSSYKVLANLNRTDNGSKSQEAEGGDAPARAKAYQKNSQRGAGVDTLEHNIDNINVNKLEQDYDVDPLFHKMSKTFDEGGAKGLLLVNLGVSSKGCNILFDNSAYEDEQQSNPARDNIEDTSKEETAEAISDEIVEEKTEEEVENGEEKATDDGMEQDAIGEDDIKDKDQISPTPLNIDTSPFISKLQELLNGAHIATLPLVPQLGSLREDITFLENEGFVADNPTPKKSQRYAADAEEEEEAERSIHHDALERSRISACNLTYDASAMSFSGFGGDDYGDDADNDVSQVFSGLDFSLLDANNDNEFSSNKNDEFVDKAASKQQKSTGRMLDLICKSNLVGVETDYQFFNDALLQKMTSGNFWAGANHWKRSKKIDNEKKDREPEEKVLRKKSNKIRTYLDFSASNQTSLESLIDRSVPKQARGKGELQYSATAISNQLKNEYVLPLDAVIGVEQMTQLFLREATIKAVEKKSKTVGFNLDETMFHHDDEPDYGGDDDGPGFALNQSEADFGDYDNYQAQCAGDIRKVDKIEVKYATVSKKVDVKRLKRDLWSELEVSTGMKTDLENNSSENTEEKDHDHNSSMDDPGQDKANDLSMKDSQQDESNDADTTEIVSFKETLHKIDESQSQNGVTLPYYFICLLHLANEKGLRLDSVDLNDIIVSADDGRIIEALPIVKSRKSRKKKVEYEAESDSDES